MDNFKIIYKILKILERDVDTEEFNDNEIYNAQYYTYTLRNGDYPPLNWKGY